MLYYVSSDNGIYSIMQTAVIASNSGKFSGMLFSVIADKSYLYTIPALACKEYGSENVLIFNI